MGRESDLGEFGVLLENARGIRGLARRLAGSAEAAEELEQETWVAALRFPEQARRRSWWARVVRNLASDRRKLAARRAARERRAVEQRLDQDGGARVSELVERAELHRALVGAVLELPEPYREVVLERFFEGRSSREIAAGSGRPVATVRTQVQRGVALLRQRLEARWGGAWRQSCLLLAGAPAASSALGVSISAVLMSSKLKVLLPAAALLLLITWIAVRPGEPAESGAEVREPAAGAAVGLPAGAVPGEGERRTVLAPEFEPETPPTIGAGSAEASFGELSGFVLDRDGAGIAGATVVTWQDREITRTDAEGAFTLSLRSSWSRNPYRVLHAWAPGYQLAYLQLSGPAPANLRLLPATPATVQVVDAQTEVPIQGATLRVLLAGRSTSNDGDFLPPDWLELPFQLPSSDADGRIPVDGIDVSFGRVSAAGYEDSLHFFAGETRSPIRIALNRARAFPVRFLGPDQQPWGGARVDFDPSDGSLVTDERGWVEVPEICRQDFHALGVRHEERGFVFVQDPKSGFRSRLEPGQVLEIGFLPREGRFLASAQIRWQDFEVATSAAYWDVGERLLPDPKKVPGSLSWIPLEADGSFRVDRGWQGLRTMIHLRRVEDGELVHSAELHGPGPYEISLPAPSGGAATIRVRAEPPAFLAGARLRLQPERVPGGAKVVVEELVEGEAISSLRAGTWSLFLEGDDWPDKVLIGRLRMPEQDAVFEFPLGELRSLSGRVTAAGRPVTSCELRISLADGYLPPLRIRGLSLNHAQLESGFVVRRRPDENGEWELPWVPDAPLRVQVSSEDFWLHPGDERFFDIPAGVAEARIELPVGALELSSSTAEALRSRDIQVWRRELPERGGEVIVHQDFVDTGRLPDLRSGPVAVVALEGQIEWFHRDPNFFLSPAKVVLRQGERLPVDLRLLPAGEVVTVWEDRELCYHAESSLEPVAPGAPASRSFVSREYNARAGGFFDAYSAVPGAWRYTLSGPVAQHDTGLRPNGLTWGDDQSRWPLDIQVQAGRRTVITVREEAGELVLTSQIE